MYCCCRRWLRTSNERRKGKQKQSHKEPPTSSMSLLLKKMNHGSHPLLCWIVICANGCPLEQEPLQPANPRGKRFSLSPLKHKSHFIGITQKNRRLSRLPGNTIMKACMHTHYGTSPNTKIAGMEIIDREREKEWLEQMDTILIFVCHTCFGRFGRIDWLSRLRCSPVS